MLRSPPLPVILPNVGAGGVAVQTAARGAAQVGVVDPIEAVHAQLHVGPFSQPEVLEHRDVPVLKARRERQIPVVLVGEGACRRTGGQRLCAAGNARIELLHRVPDGGAQAGPGAKKPSPKSANISRNACLTPCKRRKAARNSIRRCAPIPPAGARSRSVSAARKPRGQNDSNATVRFCFSHAVGRPG